MFDIDKKLYPFSYKYYNTEYGKIHYIDEGEGEIILFVHGTPSWSFEYRHYIKNLSKKYRCIAIDHLGFGKSDKPIDFEGTPENHNQNLVNFINDLNLKIINLVVHDFGGVIGLPYAIDNIDNINKIVIFNTWLWETKNDKEVIKIDKLINSRLGKFLYLNLNFSPKVLLKKGFHNKSKLTKEIHQSYILPFANKNSRKHLYDIAKSLMGSSNWYESYWKKADILNNKEIILIWGSKDEFINEKHLVKWKSKLTTNKIHQLKCGHFVQEECPQESLEIIEKFLESNQ